MSSTLWPRRFRLIPGVVLMGMVPILVPDRVAGDIVEGTKGAAVIDAHVVAGVLDFGGVLAVGQGVTSSVVLFDWVLSRGDPISTLPEVACNGR